MSVWRRPIPIALCAAAVCIQMALVGCQRTPAPPAPSGEQNATRSLTSAPATRSLRSGQAASGASATPAEPSTANTPDPAQVATWESTADYCRASGLSQATIRIEGLN